MIPVIITAGVVVAIVFNLLKVYIELAVPVAVTDKDGTTHPNALHDPTLRLAVILIGVLVGLATFALTGQAWTLHRAAQAVIDGAQIGLAAIIAYHLVPGDFIPSPLSSALTAGVAPLEPQALQAYTPPVQRLEVTHIVAGQPPTAAPDLPPTLPPPAGDTPPAPLEGPPAG